MPEGFELEAQDELALSSDAVLDGGEVRSEGTFLRNMVRVFSENKLAIISLAFLIFMVAFCFLGPLVYHTNQTNAQEALQQSTQNAHPSAKHLLGTDETGFDILGRIMYGGQISLIVGFVSAIVATVVGVADATQLFTNYWRRTACLDRRRRPKASSEA